MKKLYYVIYTCNLLFAFLLISAYLVYYTKMNVYLPLIAVVGIIYVILFKFFRRDKYKVTKTDIHFMFLYIGTVFFIEIFSVVYQMNFNSVFNLFYYSCLLIVPHLLFLIEGLLNDK